MNEVKNHKALRYILRWISRVYPYLSPDEQSKLLASKLRHMQTHRRFWYRLQVIRKLTASIRKMDLKWNSKKMLEEVDRVKEAPEIGETIEFSARVYSIAKGSNKVMLRIIRHKPTDKTIPFHYSTKNGVAKKDLHFLSKSETVQFKPGEKIKEIYIDLVEGAMWQFGDVFYVRLKLVVKENQKYVRAFVTCSGYHNECKTFNVYYKTEAVTAKCDKDYKGITNGVLTFMNNEYEKYIDVRIFDDMNEEKDETFNIHLIASTEDVTIGPNKCAVITIICDDNVLKI
ncbi:hypothetical protein WUBG_12512 [Wuchereria bancrofti]|uniref:Calx-beta domain-containing protein n=1 Tax=Wuchereria bancrofti TaxID=6293 RepID=J9EHV8_WUCBA|nr:hypothetical protein WUBG_12512 [Wuchereria bancrofti]